MVTSRKQKEKPVQWAAQEFERAFEVIPDLVAIFDRDQRIMRANRAMRDVFGRGIIGSKCFSCFHLDEKPPENCPFTSMALDRQEHTQEVSIDHLGKHFRVTVSPLLDADGRLDGCVHVAHDITERKQAEDALRQRNVQLEALREVTLSITAELDLGALLHTITEHALTLFRADAGELFLHRPEREVMELAVRVGVGMHLVNRVLRRGEGLAGRVWETGAPLVMDREAHSPETAKADKTFPWGSALGAPIRWRGEFLGVLGILALGPEVFSEADKEMVELFATQAAVAIVNARLYAKVEYLAVVDELTVVFNRRGLAELGEREVERAWRFEHPLSVLFIDIDRFKELNDLYSHDVGDRMLRAVGEQVSASVREIDIVARYGGDEFVVLLVETDLRGAREVAERIRDRVEAASLPTERGPARVTVSIGVASFGPGIESLEALIHRADDAMYAAKQAGRDRIVVRELDAPANFTERKGE